MSEFSNQWLQVREPVDHAARSEAVLSAVAHYFLNDEKLNITDIGCGTGSTLRGLRPFLNQEIVWHLIDHDDALLACAKKGFDGGKMTFSAADLASSLDPVFAEPVSLITTSAFLDLVSQSWLEKFVTEVTSRKIPFYAALTYDGRTVNSPAHDWDELVVACVNKHQLTDKGFGPALGPTAADIALNLFRQSGYEIVSEKSDWKAHRNRQNFQTMLMEGWHKAACEIEPENTGKFDQWLAFRKQAILHNISSVEVGHLDFLAVPC